MKVLIACEYSGIVREEFTKLGHYAVSCDLIDTEIPGNHYKGDVFDIINDGWDMMIAFPPCTHLAISGAKHFKEKREKNLILPALQFVCDLMNCNIEKVCIENPVGLINSKIEKPTQIIQPWQFGHGETKKTCLWLYDLPPLIPTNIVEGRENRIHKMPPSPERGKIRSKTYIGIARAMALQWCKL